MTVGLSKQIHGNSSILIFLLLFLTLLAYLAPDSVPAAWIHQSPLPGGEIFNSTWVDTSKTVFLVGDAGFAAIGKGCNWTVTSTGIPEDLYDVWGFSEKNVFAVGTFGEIIHYDGSSWSSMNSGITTALRGIWGSSATNV